MASKTTSLIGVALILFVISLCTIKLVGDSELHSRSYEMASSRRLLGESNLINQNKQAFDKPHGGNYGPRKGSNKGHGSP
ncbi:unnamed protein product [Trifolium pratense]|uniref:Uncharacterized protein n=1 Tax=Trifolium pratense TaxID=57577 RepID=A0ACB0L6P9_TRIPR|nr:unnamed protein product [Trifolium pratense]